MSRKTFFVSWEQLHVLIGVRHPNFRFLRWLQTSFDTKCY